MIRKELVKKTLERHLVTSTEDLLIWATSLDEDDVKEGFGCWYTTCYDVFKIVKGNRNINKTHLDKLIASIKKDGWKTGNTIVVNECLQIIEGQHRFLALKTLGLPIEFKMIYGATIEDVITYNSTQKAWGSVDYIKSYAQRAEDNDKYYTYAELDRLHKKYNEKLNYNCLVNICLNQLGTGGAYPFGIREGDFSLTEEQIKEAEEKCDFAYSFRNYISDKKNSPSKSYPGSVYQVIAWLYGLDICDNKILAKLIKNDFDKITIAYNRGHYLDEISKKYSRYAINKKTKQYPVVSFNIEYLNRPKMIIGQLFYPPLCG